jgi:hypothetical protein
MRLIEADGISCLFSIGIQQVNGPARSSPFVCRTQVFMDEGGSIATLG